MSVWNVENCRVSWAERQEPAMGREGKERVKAIMNKLADVVYDEPAAVGLSAVVSYLGVLLAEMNDPFSEVVNTSAVLHALVQMNLANPLVPHIVYRCEVAE
jgi:hypothetical protein